MKENKHKNYLNSDSQLTIEQVKEIILELKDEAINKTREIRDFDDWKLHWYNGEIIGLQITLNLLERIKR